jgi:hypothetical protein
MTELEKAARRLYEEDCNQVKPTWDQLGDTTRELWKERADSDQKTRDSAS